MGLDGVNIVELLCTTTPQDGLGLGSVEQQSGVEQKEDRSKRKPSSPNKPYKTKVQQPCLARDQVETYSTC
jgi:hypothetical protein